MPCVIRFAISTPQVAVSQAVMALYQTLSKRWLAVCVKIVKGKEIWLWQLSVRLHLVAVVF